MDGRWLINLEELPSAVPMVQAALYQFVLDRRCGEYELPGAALIACGNREASGGIHRMPMPLTGAPATTSRPRCSSSSRYAPSCCTPSTPNRRRRPSPFRGPGSSPPTSCTAGMALPRSVSARCSGCRRGEITAYGLEKRLDFAGHSGVAPRERPCREASWTPANLSPAGTSRTVRAPFEHGALFAGAGRAPSSPR